MTVIVNSAPLQPPRRALAFQSALNLASGVSLSIVPPAVLSISANTFAVPSQGIIAVAVMAATFFGQVMFGFLVESRLATPGTERFVAVPRLLTIVGLVAAVGLALFSQVPLVVAVTLPFLFAALETGRGVSVAERYSTREAWSAVALGLGAGLGVILALVGQQWGLIPLAAGIAAAILVRAVRAPWSSPRPDPAIRAWVVADVTLTGVSYPLLNALILALLGPAAATVFAAVSTVSGLLAVPLNFLRVRLLKEHSLLDTVVTGAALLAATGAIAIGEATGLFGLAFGVSWTLAATALPLTIACLWRFASLFSAIPFTALRRAGRARLVTILRGAAAAFTFGIAIPATFTQQIWMVFGALLIGEVVLAATCEIARRRAPVRHGD
ncbi:hypothetical protein BH11ACT5_BH11ACT5_15020 [soil metagenome]